MEASNQYKLNLNKEFNTPVDALYKAWITPAALKAWWHPMGNILKEAITQPAVNAPLKYVFDTNEGTEAFTVTGTYKEVEAGKHLRYTWNWKLPTPTVDDSDFELTIDFSGEDGKSTLAVMQSNFSSEEAVVPHKEGWEEALESLAQYLQKQA